MRGVPPPIEDPMPSTRGLPENREHHAYVVFSLPLQFHLASNAVPLVLVK